VSIIIQQDATIYSLFISANCSTRFRWYLHPSSGAHTTVSTVSGITETAKDKITSKCLCYKADPLQARRGPEGSRKLRFPDFVTMAQDGGRLSALRTGPLYPQEMLLVLISVRG